MSASEEQINQWLEEGLRHYGLGDPAKALDVWLQVLAVDANNTRAKEYVEIVRSTYGEEAVAEAEAAITGSDSAPALRQDPKNGADAKLSADAKPPSSVDAASNAASTDASESAADGSAVDAADDSAQKGHPETAPSIASALPVTNIDDAHVDPLDSIDGPSWADVAADAESASNAFSATSYSSSALYDAKTELSLGAASQTIVDDDSDEGEPAKPAEARTSGAAGPVHIETSDESGAVGIATGARVSSPSAVATSASVKIGGRATPIEESSSNVVHSVRYGESFDDSSSPKAGPYFDSLREKARGETQSIEFNRSEIRSASQPKLPNPNDTVEIRADDMAAAAAADSAAAAAGQQAKANRSTPPPARPQSSPLEVAVEKARPSMAAESAASTVELDRTQIPPDAKTVRIPTMDLTLGKDETLPGISKDLLGGANSIPASIDQTSEAPNSDAASSSEPPDNTPIAPSSEAPNAAADASSNGGAAKTDDDDVDIFAPTPLAAVPTTPGSDLFSELQSSKEEDTGSARSTQEGEPSSTVSEAFRNAWGDDDALTMDLDVDPAAPSMFDLLLSASDRSNESKPMDVGVLRQKKSPEDGKRGASQDMAPLMSTPAFAAPAKTDAESVEVSDEKHECDVLMDGAKELFGLGDFSGSLELVEKVLEIDADHAEAKNYFKQNASTLLKMYESKLGNLDGRPTQLTSPDEVIWMNMHHRAGFVLSQVDGGLTYEEIADVSGLPRLETFRILAELKQNGVIG